MGLISRVSSRTYRKYQNNMKVKGDLKEYSIIGRKLPSAMDPNPKLFRQQIFAPDSVSAKSRFWKFLSYYKKINKKVGEVVECKEIHERHPGSAKNYGVNIRYYSRSTTENMYREYRDVTLAGAVTQMYREMAGRHRARPGSIQVLKTKVVKAADCRRPQNQAMHDATIKLPLPRRIPSKAKQNARRFAVQRPNTVFLKKFTVFTDIFN